MRIDETHDGTRTDGKCLRCRTEDLEPIGLDSAAHTGQEPGSAEFMRLYQCIRCLAIWRLSVHREPGQEERREMTRL